MKGLKVTVKIDKMTAKVFAAEVGRLSVTFILCISVVLGKVDRLCFLKGSSVDLPCSPKYPTFSKVWYTVHHEDHDLILTDVFGKRNSSWYDMMEKRNFSLIISDLKASDQKYYCCGNVTEVPGRCWVYRTELGVADLQVKVIPTAGGQSVTLMCSTSCVLTEEPAAYVWFKNGEFLSEDSSPWYQEPVGSDEAVTYSCAIKGYENFSAPEVSVDAVSSDCFNVTYRKGEMCSYMQKAADTPCLITFPREVFVVKAAVENSATRLACTPSCPLTETAYRWYLNKKLYKYSESEHLTVPVSSTEISCVVKGHEYLHSEEVCGMEQDCWIVNYVSRQICAVEGSSVDITSKYSYPKAEKLKYRIWFKIKAKMEIEKLTKSRRLKFYDSKSDRYTLQINSLMKNDSARYIFIPEMYRRRKPNNDFPGVTLIVTGLHVMIRPSREVREAQRVTLTCRTSCPLTENTSYLWYLNDKPLNRHQSQDKHLVLDNVSSRNQGNYSCAVKQWKDIKSPPQTLTVQAKSKSASYTFARMTLVILSPLPLISFKLWMKKRSYNL